MDNVEVLAVVVIAIAAVVLGVMVFQRRQSPSTGAEPVAPKSTVPDRARPKVAEFHVRGDDALVYFDVPLPATGADDVLRDLLVRAAVEVVEEKRSHDLPLSDLVRVRAFGRRGGDWAEAGSVDLEHPGQLPRLDALPDIMPHASSTGFDPLAEVAEQEFKVQPGIAEGASDKGLAPIGKELKLAGVIDAALRSQSVDPASMTVTDLTLALLRLGGYSVADAGDGGYMATRAGASTYLRIVDHEPGGYPELAESAVNSFLIGFGGKAADRGLLVTDKFGPFVIYEKERREKRVKFITRERLQAFVDSFVAG